MNTVRYWLLLIAVLAVGYASFTLWRQDSAAPPASPGSAQTTPAATHTVSATAAPAGRVTPFTLTDQNDQPFDSASLQGKVWVASFFFTNCPSACWRMNQALSAYQQTHPDSEAEFVSITCDPDNDTPEALTRYAEHFKADPKRWVFLTGEMDQIEKIGQDSFKISVVKKVHSDRACVVDRNGQVRGSFRLTEPDQVKLLEQLLAVVEAEQPDTSQPSEAADSNPSDGAASDDSETEAAEQPTSS